MMRLAAGDKAPHALAVVAFVESSVFPIPPDVMLIPMVLAKRGNAFWYATLCTLASVLGGLAGYAIGYFLFESVGRAVLAFYGLTQGFERLAALYNEWGLWVLLIKGMTPFPYKVLTIFSGFTGMDLVVFTLASITARAMRFYLVAGLLYWLGPQIREFIERRLSLVTTVFVILLVGGFLAVTYLF
jgi:membrane protein YqaA with SNARE-associated domain